MKMVLGLLWIMGLAVSAAAAPTRYVIQATGNLPGNFGAMVTKSGGNIQKTFPNGGAALATSSNTSFAANMAKQGFLGLVAADMTIQWVPSPSGAAGETLSGPAPDAPPANDPTAAFFYACQWNLEQIDAPGAWAKGQFGDGIKIAVIDSGIDPYHVELVGRVDLAESTSVLSPGSSPCGDETTINDLVGHGTFVSSIITSNGVGIAGVAPNATIVAVKALNCFGAGSIGDVLDAIYYAASLPDVQIINMSIASLSPKSTKGVGQMVGTLTRAINYATSVGKFVVSASGNDGLDLQHATNYVEMPCELGTTVCVYATNNEDTLASYSNYGAGATWVGAPGGDYPNNLPANPDCPGIYPGFPVSYQGKIIGALSGFQFFGEEDHYTDSTGTSFAAPIVAGVAALVDGKHGGTLSPSELKTILSQSAVDLGKTGTDNLYSHGRVNASDAVDH